MGNLVTGMPIRRMDFIIKMAERNGGICAFLSLGERLVSKPSFDQVTATRSFRRKNLQVVSRWLPPFS